MALVKRWIVLVAVLGVVIAGGAGWTVYRMTRTSSAADHPPGGRPSASASGAPSASPSVTASELSWSQKVAAENAQPGTHEWVVSSVAGEAPGLDAYADRVSVLPGQSVNLYISCGHGVRVRAYRIGWYGGLGGRLIWSGGEVQAPVQPAKVMFDGPIPDLAGMRNTQTVIAPWKSTLTVNTTGWPEGDYLFRLDVGKVSRYVPLTVRSADARGRILLVAGAMTWQAYNDWGGASLYDGEDGTFGARSRAVSFDRPYQDGYGSGRFKQFDLGILQVAERLGLPLAWATDYDVANDPGLVTGASAVVVGGHAEYWTATARDAVQKAVAAGANLAVFGANTAYWRVRLAGRTIGLQAQPDRRDGRPRIIMGAKDAGTDPLAKSDPGGATARFRDSPHPRPEELFTGMRYDCFPAEAPWTVSDPGWWGYAGTGVKAGQTFPSLIGPESDRVYPAPDRPSPMQVVGYTKFMCNGHMTAQTGVYWVAPSGAAVFTAGTFRWACAANASCSIPNIDSTAKMVTKVTENLLQAFATPRAGRTHPAKDTVSRYWLPARSTTRSS